MNERLPAPPAAPTRNADIAPRLQARWWWVVAGLFAGGVLGLLVATLLPKRYEGRTTVLVSPSKLSEQGGQDPLTVDAYVELVRSTEAAQRVVEQFKLGETDGLTPLQLLQRRLVVRQVRGTQLIEVAVRLRDPARAAEVANALAREGVRIVGARATQEAHGAVAEIGAQLEQARKRLDEAQARLLQTRSASQVELIEKDSTSLLTERAKLLTLEVEIAAEQGRIEMTSAQLAKTPEKITVTRGLDRSTAMLEANRTSGGPVSLDVQMNEQVLNPAHQTIQAALATARGRLAGLEESRQRMRGQLQLGAERLPRLNELYRSQTAVDRLKVEYEIAVKAYSEIAEQHELASLRVVTRSAKLYIVDAGLRPERPVFPSRTLFAMGGGVILAFLAAAVALLRPLPPTT